MMLCYADEDSTSSYAHRCMWNVVHDHRKRKKEISCYCLKDTIAYEISFSFHIFLTSCSIVLAMSMIAYLYGTIIGWKKGGHIVVDFPAPLISGKPNNSPSLTWKLISFTAVKFLYFLFKWNTSIMFITIPPRITTLQWNRYAMQCG